MTLKEKLLQKREKAKRLDEAQVSKFLCTKHDLRHREFVIPNGMNFEHIIEYAMRLAKQDGVEAYKDEVQSIGFWNFVVKW